MNWKTEKARFDSRKGREIFLHSVFTGSGVPLASYPEAAGALSPMVKRAGLEADHWLPFSGEVKNEWSCTSSLLYVYTSWCFIKLKATAFPKKM